MTTATTQTGACNSGCLDHAVSFYRSDAEFHAAVTGFTRDGVAAGEPVLVAAPGPRLAALRAGLADLGDAVTFVDSAGVGANPARLIPAYHQFAGAHRERRLRLTGELMWPGRTAGEVAELIRHEALVNLAFANVPVSIHCLYGASAVDSRIRADIERAHPVLIRDGGLHDNEDYPGPGLAPFCDQPLPPPPAAATSLAFNDATDLPALRQHVHEHGARFGLPDGRVGDLVLAVNELVTNAFVHGGGRGMLRVWPDSSSGSLTCEVTGASQIADPLAGHHFMSASASSGHGLWLVNQLCDLVQMRSNETETTVRVHLRLYQDSW